MNMQNVLRKARCHCVHTRTQVRTHTNVKSMESAVMAFASRSSALRIISV
jgi:hypothetical protein